MLAQNVSDVARVGVGGEACPEVRPARASVTLLQARLWRAALTPERPPDGRQCHRLLRSVLRCAGSPSEHLDHVWPPYYNSYGEFYLTSNLNW